eukprot:GHVL01024884.1.p1 GENE.GHVL01024884.1~~GHVL01024884.1.p1  ORF type:complete len:143 (-),score=16.34 GHVL01024884.1:316-744(-)
MVNVVKRLRQFRSQGDWPAFGENMERVICDNVPKISLAIVCDVLESLNLVWDLSFQWDVWLPLITLCVMEQKQGQFLSPTIKNRLSRVLIYEISKMDEIASGITPSKIMQKETAVRYRNIMSQCVMELASITESNPKNPNDT